VEASSIEESYRRAVIKVVGKPKEIKEASRELDLLKERPIQTMGFVKFCLEIHDMFR
jgi:hypothetical protein